MLGTDLGDFTLAMIILHFVTFNILCIVHIFVVPPLKGLQVELNERISSLENHTASALDDLQSHIEEYKNETASELADLKSHIEQYKNEIGSELADLQSQIEGYKSQTASELADLQSSIDEYKNQTASELATLRASLHSPSRIDAISAAVLQVLWPHINNMTEIVSDRISETKRSLNKAFENTRTRQLLN